MKSHLLLLRVVLIDMGTRCCTSTTRDFKRITSRVEHEGLSFLTITLPQFCKDFERCLDKGAVDSTDFEGYSKSGYLPRILGGFTSLVFCSETGCILENPSVDAIYAIRQICLLFGKINHECSDARVIAAMEGYLKCEMDVYKNSISMDYSETEEFKKMALCVFEPLFSVVDRKIHDLDIVPRHGPGATADKLSGNGKYYQLSWTERLEEVFPHEEFLFPSWNPLVDSTSVHIHEPGAEIPVRVITVPKTMKTPRIIAIEPTCMQYVQQGLMEVIVGGIESDDLLSSLIGFADQTPNQEMAKQGSLTGSLATLDLSEASDRVSNLHVELLTAYFPWLAKGIQACRSSKADVPGFGVVHLSKFASMGSALCFPIEAMVFLTIILLGVQDELMHPLTREDIYALRGKVRVYGDDIIIPVEYVRSVVRRLEAFGLIVNSNKSFWTGKFRESCGKEYYAGEDVSVVRVRRDLPTQRRHVQEIISAVSLRNQMYFAGNWATARWLDEQIRRLIPFPTVLPESPALGRHSHLSSYDEQRECKYLQKPLVRAYVVKARLPKSQLDDRPALLKWFLKRGSEPFASDHLERAGRPDAVDIKLRWVSPT